MAEPATKLPVKTEEKKAEPTSASGEWRPFETLRREIQRLFDDFDGGFGILHSVAPCPICSRSGNVS